ncbi:hypothetical protein Mgra_00003705 [Meloidogyne graminicola]|uniref:CHK kinase-like domain-containing protein n=1 Tax=Meloidogyne graminicola TaxID=189291 RepID=A0A8S9ZU29_9BILA|nr:hypothetical protein Mgra_00003705 [Meloidogyne graminicola]
MFNNFLKKYKTGKLALEYIEDYNWITFEYIINKLIKGSDKFRKLLENGGIIEKSANQNRLIKVLPLIYSTQLILSRLIFIQKLTKSSKRFSLILKIFAEERIELLMEHFVGKEKFQELLINATKNLEINQENINNNEENIKNNKKIIMKEMMKCFKQMHQNECLFYEMFKQIKNPPLPLPQIYFTKLCLEDENELKRIKGPQGLILMENLTEFTYVGRLSIGLNEIQINEIIKHLAHLHAFLLLPNIKKKWEKEFTTIDKMWDQNMSKEFNLALFEQIKQLDDVILEPFKKISSLLYNAEFLNWMKNKCINIYGIPEILNHGDLWNNNLLWYKNDPNKIAAIIDWQLATIGNPMVDVTRLMLATVDPELRHKMEMEGNFLKIYLNELNNKLIEQKMEKVKYGFEELQHVYNLSLIIQAAGRVMEIPFFERGTSKNDPEFKEKIQCIKMRAKFSINDAVRILEKEAPEWLK